MAETTVAANCAGKEPVKPSFPRFLIALFLVKSKPIGLLVPDYIRALQACVTQGPPPDKSANARYHVDTSALWHEQYKKSEESQIELRARLSELESLHAAAKAEIASKQVQQRKRKRITNEPGHALNTNARTRLRAPALDPVSQSFSDSLKPPVDELGTSSLDHRGSNLPQNFFTLQKLASTRTPCGHSLAIALSQVSSDIRLIISSITASQHNNIVAVRNVTTRSQERGSCKAHGERGQDLETRLVAIGCIFPCLLNAISQITEGVQGVVAQPRIIHGIIGLLRDLLERLLVLAAENSKNSPYAKYQTGKKLQLKAVFPLPDDTVMKLCRLTIRLVTSLDIQRATDQEVLDGFLYFLLGRVGAMLKMFVFGPDSNEILRPNYESQIPQVTSSSYDEERKAAEAQAPYLIYILARIVPLAEEHRKYTTRHAVQTPRLSIPPLKTARLSHPASATLQSTLLAAVFGPKCSAEFVDGLVYPLSNDVDPDVHIGFESDAAGLETAECMADWFKAEVWRVLGWEVLSGKIAWDE